MQWEKVGNYRCREEWGDPSDIKVPRSEFGIWFKNGHIPDWMNKKGVVRYLVSKGLKNNNFVIDGNHYRYMFVRIGYIGDTDVGGEIYRKKRPNW
jgi:hypothetical protein